jgi:hypothetical protein
MSSRAEEKRRRREERQARERELAQSATRRRRLQMVGGTGLGVAAVVAIVVAVTAGGSSNALHKASGAIPNVPIPAQQNTDLTTAAAAAKCTVLNPPSEGRTHVTTQVTYVSNPPSSGNHYPVPAHDGIYDPGNTPPKEQLVHSLEHGRIEVQYAPGTSNQVIGQLEQLLTEFATADNDPRALLFQNTTNMPYAIAAVAWTHLLGCKQYSPKVFDAIRAFRASYDLKAPEQVIGAE